MSQNIAMQSLESETQNNAENFIIAPRAPYLPSSDLSCPHQRTIPSWVWFSGPHATGGGTGTRTSIMIALENNATLFL